MNISKPTYNNNSTTGDIAVKLGTAEEVISYAIRGISAFGVLFNLTTILLLFKSKFQHKFYDFLQCRCVCNLTVCLLFAYYSPTACRGCVVDYKSLIVNIGFLFPLRMALIASGISDNLLILNRLANLCRWSNSVFSTLSKKVNVLVPVLYNGRFLSISVHYFLGQSLDLHSCVYFINDSRLFCSHI